MIKNADPCAVYFPSPVILSAKIHGHMIEQNSPPESRANSANCPDAKTPINMPVMPRRLKIFKVAIGLSFAKKKPPI